LPAPPEARRRKTRGEKEALRDVDKIATRISNESFAVATA